MVVVYCSSDLKSKHVRGENLTFLLWSLDWIQLKCKLVLATPEGAALFSPFFFSQTLSPKLYTFASVKFAESALTSWCDDRRNIYMQFAGVLLEAMTWAVFGDISSQSKQDK